MKRAKLGEGVAREEAQGAERQRSRRVVVAANDDGNRPTALLPGTSAPPDVHGLLGQAGTWHWLNQRSRLTFSGTPGPWVLDEAPSSPLLRGDEACQVPGGGEGARLGPGGRWTGDQLDGRPAGRVPGRTPPAPRRSPHGPAVGRAPRAPPLRPPEPPSPPRGWGRGSARPAP